MGNEKSMKDNPSQRLVLEPHPSQVHPSGVIALFFLCEIQGWAGQKLFWRRPESTLEGAFSGTLSFPHTHWTPIPWPNWLGQESRRTKVSRIFRIFVPNFAPNFAPNFLRIFRGLFVLRFVGDGDQKKFTKNPRHFSMQNSQATTEKIFTKFFWRAGKVTIENHEHILQSLSQVALGQKLSALIVHFHVNHDDVRRLKCIQCSVGAWKCLRRLPPDPNPYTG